MNFGVIMDEIKNMFSKFVHTKVVEDAKLIVDDSIKSNTFLVLAVVGNRGFGKTSLLRYLINFYSSKNHLAIYANDQQSKGFFETLSNLSNSLIELMEHDADYLNRHLNFVKSIEVLNDIRMRAISDPVENIVTALRMIDNIIPKERSIFFFLDDMEPGRDERLFATFVRKLTDSNIPRIKLIIASREYYFTHRISSSVFKILKMKSLDSVEASHFIEKLLPTEREITLDEKQLLINITDGSPLLLSLFVNNIADFSDGTPVTIQETIKNYINNLFETAQPTDTEHTINPRVIIDIIAVFNGIEFGVLSELLEFQDENLWPILDELINKSLITIHDGRNQNTRIEISHTLFREYIINDILLTSDFDFKDLQFGAEAAENDRQLYKSLVENPWIFSLNTGDKSIVLGDRGSGKSALFRILTENPSQVNNSSRSDECVDAVLYEKDPSVFIQRMMTRDSEATSAEGFKAIWLSYIAAIFAHYCLNSSKETSNIDSTFTKDARRLVRLVGWSNRLTKSNAILKPLLSLMERLHLKVSLKIGPVTVEPTSGVSGIPLLNSQVDIEHFLVEVDKILLKSGNNHKIVIDRVDEIYKYRRDIQEALVQGLFLAETYLNQFENIDIIILLRTDLFEIYDIQEKNKFQSRIIILNWSESEIISALLKRLYSNSSLKMLSEKLSFNPTALRVNRTVALKLVFPEHIEGKRFEDWLVESIRNGRGRVSPRQIILFLNIARDILIDNGQLKLNSFPIFPTSVLNLAMNRLSELSYDEFLSDFRIATNLVRNCRAGRIIKFKIDEINELYDASEGSITHQIELLERLGFLRRIVARSDEGNLITWFEIPDIFTRCWLGEAPST